MWLTLRSHNDWIDVFHLCPVHKPKQLGLLFARDARQGFNGCSQLALCIYKGLSGSANLIYLVRRKYGLGLDKEDLVRMLSLIR